MSSSSLLLLPANAIAIVIIPIRPRGFSLLAFNLRSRALAASSTAVATFFRSFFRSFRASRLRFWCSIAVRFVQSLPTPPHLTSPPTGIHALSWIVGLSEKLCKQFLATCFDLDFPPSVCPPLECLSRVFLFSLFSRCFNQASLHVLMICYPFQVAAAGGPAGEVCVENVEVLVVVQEIRKT